MIGTKQDVCPLSFINLLQQQPGESEPSLGTEIPWSRRLGLESPELTHSQPC